MTLTLTVQAGEVVQISWMTYVTGTLATSPSLRKQLTSSKRLSVASRSSTLQVTIRMWNVLLLLPFSVVLV